MTNIIPKFIIFLVSSLVVVALLYFKTSIIFLQQIILFLIVILIIIFRFQKYFEARKVFRDWLLIFIITLFVQLLIASTGAVFSPFFILIHLYVIGLSLFFNFSTALMFLIIEFAVIFLNIRFDSRLLELVKGDFGSATLYFASILVITPISKIISQQYHIKADVLKTLFRQLSSQESIIEEIDAFVFTTDKNLVVLSANEPAKKIINLSQDNGTITDLVELIDKDGKRLSKESLLSSLSTITQKKTISSVNKIYLAIKGYNLKIPGNKITPRVVIKVNPIVNQNNVVEKLIFLISRSTENENLDSVDTKLQKAHGKYLSVLNILNSDPIISKLATLNLYLDLLKKYERDILTTSELNLYPSSIKTNVTDVFRVFAKIYEQYQKQLKKINVEYKLNLSEDLEEEYRLSIANNSLSEELTQTSSVSAVTDQRLLQILIEKTMDIVTAIAYANKGNSSAQNKQILVELGLKPSIDNIKLIFETKFNPNQKEAIEGFLSINKGKYEVLDNLTFSSGLESHIIENIIDNVGISFTADFNQYSSKLSFTLTLDKFYHQTKTN